MKKYILLLSLVFMSMFVFSQALEIHYFYGETCPHCTKVKPTLDAMEEKYGENIIINRYEIYKNQENNALFQTFLTKYNTERGGVPSLFVNDKILVGSRQIPEELENIIKEYIQVPTPLPPSETNIIVSGQEPEILNVIKENPESDLLTIVQNPFVLLIIVIILIIIAFEVYKITDKKQVSKKKELLIKKKPKIKKSTKKRVKKKSKK